MSNHLPRPVHAFALCAAAALSSVATADNDVRHFVPADHPTIQAAIDAAQAGETVLVAPGVYTGPGNRDLDFGGKDITVRGLNGPEDCIIDCEGDFQTPFRAFIFENGESRNARVEGFTITGGSTLPGAIADQFNGGAILIADSSPTIANCVFKNNVAGCWGGALYTAYSGSPLIVGCTFDSNYAGDDGGGLFSWLGAAPVIVSTAFVRNSAVVTGGAISAFDGGRLVLDGVTVADNEAPHGAGVFTYAPTLILNSIIWDNTSDFNSDQVQSWSTGANIVMSFSNIMGGFPGMGNVDTDPLFASDGFHLLADSPCIDAGTASRFSAGHTDLDGDARVAGAAMDMGADEAMP